MSIYIIQYYSHIMSGKARRLNALERLEVISKLNQTNPRSKQSIARQYKVSEATIRNVWAKRKVIQKPSDLMRRKRKNLERLSGGLNKSSIKL